LAAWPSPEPRRGRPWPKTGSRRRRKKEKEEEEEVGKKEVCKFLRLRFMSW
jgi:hypothetical protein